MKFPAIIILGLGAAVALLAGCKTPPKTSETKKESSAQKEEYVQVQTMGSWIPRKVKKKEDILGDSTLITDGRAIERANEQGRTNPVKESQLRDGQR